MEEIDPQTEHRIGDYNLWGFDKPDCFSSSLYDFFDVVSILARAGGFQYWVATGKVKLNE
jgi:hypothetical protein